MHKVPWLLKKLVGLVIPLPDQPRTLPIALALAFTINLEIELATWDGKYRQCSALALFCLDQAGVSQ